METNENNKLTNLVIRDLIKKEIFGSMCDSRKEADEKLGKFIELSSKKGCFTFRVEDTDRYIVFEENGDPAFDITIESYN